MVQGELREQESRFHSVARQEAPSPGPIIGQPGLLCAERALSPPSPALGSPYQASQGLATSFATSAPGGCREHLNTHTYAHTLMLLHSKPEPYSQTLTPSLTAPCPPWSRSQHEAHDMNSIPSLSPSPLPESYKGFGRDEEGTKASALATFLTTSRTRCPGLQVPTACPVSDSPSSHL